MTIFLWLSSAREDAGISPVPASQVEDCPQKRVRAHLEVQMGAMNALSLWEFGGRGSDGCPPSALTAQAKDWLPNAKR